MILEIMTREMNAMAWACTKNELNYKFIPTEMTGIVKVRISDKGREISPALAYRLGALVAAKVNVDHDAESLHEPLLEEDLTPNNVVILVEDLPG